MAARVTESRVHERITVWSVAALLFALAILSASLTFHNVWPTPAIAWRGAVSVELGAVILALAAWTAIGRRVSRAAIGWLSVGWLVLVIGRYATVTAPALWGRELNFYWDVGFLPDVVAMLMSVASAWLVAGSVVVLFLVLAGATLFIAWALARVARALQDVRLRRGLVIGSSLTVLLFAAQSAGLWPEAAPRFPEPVAAAYGRQARFLFRATTGRQALPASPSFASDLSRAKGADLFLFFIESYGAVTFEQPAFATVLGPARERLDRAIAETGRGVASAYVTSPTFGGSSWFAHITLMSGLEIGDPDRNALLMTEQRETLPRALSRQGYRTVAMMPGLWYPWPEGAFYGFDEIYNGERLGYRGPPFGWWNMTDQFVLAALDAREVRRAGRAPLFVFFPTISTHTPFAPAPPYQPDWSRMLTDHPYDDKVLEVAYEQTVDWDDMAPAYRAAVTYSSDTLAGYLREHAGSDAVFILIGDHQPPALVTGQGAPWEVPVHVVTSRTAILDQLVAGGFRRGLTPAMPTLGPMHTLTPLLLKALGDAPAP
jgi:hypothetical protein